MSKTPKPWNLDAYRNYDGDTTEEHLLVNKPIREFLDNDDKFYLIGAKGLGKTLFLRYKSYRYHEKYHDSVRFNTGQNELTENLRIHPDTLSKEELLRFRDLSIWQLIWELTLWIVVFRLYNQPMSTALEKLIGQSKELSTILTRLLNNRNKIEQYRAFASEFQEKKSLIKDAVMIFIDDVDQTLHDFLLVHHPSDEFFEGKQSPSVDTWVNAQIGLIGAIYNLNRQNAHIKIYASIRREAFEAMEGEMKINYMQHASVLEYNKNEIRVIFEKNIQLIESAQRLDPYGATPISSFLGFDEMSHRFAVDLHSNKRKESAFNFIFRHTYGRPREIVLIGQKLDALVSTEPYRTASLDDRIDMARMLVNTESRELLQQYKREIIPYFKEDKLNAFIEQVRSNVITKEDMARLDYETIREYYNLGLIGYVRPNSHTNILKQFFKRPATYNYRINQPMPETDYLLIHSTMDARLVEKHTYGNFYNKYNIIGDDYEFLPVIDNYIHATEHYLPPDVSGNRMKAGNESAGHHFPLEDIYGSFFQFDQSPKWHDKLMMQWNTAGSILGLLGRICFCKRLGKQFDRDLYAGKMQTYLTELGRYPLVRQYNAELPDAASENSLDRFLHKLIGRYITLGCYLVLDLRIEWIHELLTSGKFDFSINSNKDSAFSYLSRSFYIRELKKEEPRNPDNPEHRLMKQRIFNSLSPFEQEGIRNFIRDASDEVNYVDWLEPDAHKNWLKEQVFVHIWRPE